MTMIGMGWDRALGPDLDWLRAPSEETIVMVAGRTERCLAGDSVIRQEPDLQAQHGVSFLELNLSMRLRNTVYIAIAVSTSNTKTDHGPWERMSAQ
jgi:hypothetical protein